MPAGGWLPGLVSGELLDGCGVLLAFGSLDPLFDPFLGPCSGLVGSGLVGLGLPPVVELALFDRLPPAGEEPGLVSGLEGSAFGCPLLG